MTRRTVAILAFDDMEVLDYAGPYEVFNVAGELTDPAAFTVVSVGATPGPVVGRGGFTVVPTHTFDECPPVDLLVVPGGAGARPLLAHQELLEWLRKRAADVEVLFSVCSGALVLARAGLLHDTRATTHHTAFDELAAIDPTIQVERGPRFVRSADRIWTSAGVSAGVDLSLHLVEELTDAATRALVVEEMEWMWGS